MARRKKPENTTPRAVIQRRENAAARRARIIGDGGRRIDLLLEREDAERLASLGSDATETIVRLIREAAAR